MEKLIRDSEIKILPFDFGDDSLIDETIKLLNDGSKLKKHNLEFWDWKFNKNPFGKSIGWYAKDNNNNCLAGVLLWWPWKFTIGNVEVSFYQAINGKTNASYRNLGIFYKLNSTAINYFRSMNVGLIGFPNDQSYPSYRKLGWNTLTIIHPIYIAISPLKTITKLLAKRKFVTNSPTLSGEDNFDFNFRIDQNTFIQTSWSNPLIEWRFKMHPIHKYYCFMDSQNHFVYRIKQRGLFWEAQVVYSQLRDPGNLHYFIKHLSNREIDFLSYFGYNTVLDATLKRFIIKYRLKKPLYFVLDYSTDFGEIPFRFEMAETDSQ